MDTVVIYKTKSGFTSKYALWLSEKLDADLLEASCANIKDLYIYDTIIYGGGLYMSGINGVKFITKNMKYLHGKKVIVFATGAGVGRDHELKAIVEKNFDESIRTQIDFVYLRGGYNYNLLKPLDKILMTVYNWMIKRKKNKTADDVGMIEAFREPIDFTKKDKVKAVIDRI